MAKYKVISETFWDGTQTRREGDVVEIDPEKVHVAWNSRTLQPVDGAPVFEARVDKETGEREWVKSTRKPRAAPAPEPPKAPPASA